MHDSRPGGLEVEDDGRGVDDGDVDRGQAALVGEDEGDAEQMTDESGYAAADRRMRSRASLVMRSGEAAAAVRP